MIRPTCDVIDKGAVSSFISSILDEGVADEQNIDNLFSSHLNSEEVSVDPDVKGVLTFVIDKVVNDSDIDM